MRTFAAIVLAAGMTAECNAWWGTAHLIVARRAYDILQEENPAALAAAEAELVPLKRYYPSLTTDEQDHPFVESALFADDIKGKGYSWQSGWHYVDQPYLSDGGSLDDYDFTPDEEFITDAIFNLTSYLKGTGDYENTIYYQRIQDSFSYEEDARSFALRLVMHYVADVHQPLHATTEVNNQFPQGDRGGNSDWLPNIEGAGNLHGVWDSVIYQFAGYPKLPFTDSTWAELGDTVNEIHDLAPVSKSEYHIGDSYDWAEESLEFAIEYVYAGYDFNVPLDDDYIAKATQAADERLMNGGRRLASLITYLYGDDSAEFTQ